MEFKEMQIIWNNQDNEKLYAINETALHAYIKRKSKSVNHLVRYSEIIMFMANLIAGIILIIDAFQENEPFTQYLLSALYIAYAIFTLTKRLTRKKEEVRFEHTLLGELNKAIWQINYLINQSRTIILWYILPLMLISSIAIYFDSRSLLAWGLILILFPATYYGTRWEVNKFYLPKKRALEALRQKLITAPEQITFNE